MPNDDMANRSTFLICSGKIELGLVPKLSIDFSEYTVNVHFASPILQTHTHLHNTTASYKLAWKVRSIEQQGMWNRYDTCQYEGGLPWLSSIDEFNIPRPFSPIDGIIPNKCILGKTKKHLLIVCHSRIKVEQAAASYFFLYQIISLFSNCKDVINDKCLIFHWHINSTHYFL